MYFQHIPMKQAKICSQDRQRLVVLLFWTVDVAAGLLRFNQES